MGHGVTVWSHKAKYSTDLIVREIHRDAPRDAVPVDEQPLRRQVDTKVRGLNVAVLVAEDQLHDECPYLGRESTGNFVFSGNLV